ncbi:MAG TPA: hypothetical protein GYA10_14745 [Alphaproteobacteria bacterium]|nr:hypothetical protein [Alphaproteobacteria bacterium]
MARKARRQRAATGTAAELAAQVEDDTMQAMNEGQGSIAIEAIGYDASAIETTLNAEDAAALEQGIASVFDRLRAEAGGLEADNAAGGEAATPERDTHDTIGVEPTFALLAELNRLWARAEAA